MGTFAIVSVVQGRGEARNDISAVRGLASRNPWLAGAMLVLLLGQAGVPLTSGFLGKWVVISAVIDQGGYALGLLGMLGAAIAAFFYLRVALIMYIPAATEPAGAISAAGAGYGPDLVSVALAGLSEREKAVALRAVPTSKLRVPAPIAATVALCVAFTVFAGVSTPVLSFAHSIALPWSL
jgi:NADH:ubiquinone oxidoreductase subunit 2 (subunit N)